MKKNISMKSNLPSASEVFTYWSKKAAAEKEQIENRRDIMTRKLLEITRGKNIIISKKSK